MHPWPCLQYWVLKRMGWSLQVPQAMEGQRGGNFEHSAGAVGKAGGVWRPRAARHASGTSLTMLRSIGMPATD